MPVVSTLRHGREETLKELEKLWPPSIPFVQPKKKESAKSKDDDGDTKDKYLTFDIQLDPNDDDDEDTVEVKIPRIETATPEQWCEWRMEVEELLSEKGYIGDYSKRAKIYRGLLRGKLLEEWNTAYRKHYTDAPLIDEADNALAVEATINAVALELFPDGAGSARAQKRYLRNNLFMGKMDPEKFAHRLEKINTFLPYFPVEDATAAAPANTNTVLPQDELVDIMDYAKSIEWHITMLSQGKKPHTFADLREATVYYKQLYDAQKLQNRLDSANSNSRNKSGRNNTSKRNKDAGRGKSDPDKKKPPVCGHCGKTGHVERDCWIKDPALRPNKRARTNGNTNKKPSQSSHVLLSTADLKRLVANQKSKKKGKRKRRAIALDDNSVGSSSSTSSEGANFLDQLKIAGYDTEGKHCYTSSCMNSSDHFTNYAFTRVSELSESDSDSDSDETDSSTCNSSSGNIYNSNPVRDDANPFYPDSRPSKQQKLQHYTAEVIVELKDRTGNLRPIRALLDTGTTSSIILREFVQDGSVSRYKSGKTKWRTLGGTFKTQRKGRVDFKFPELDNNTTITWTCHVDDHNKSDTTQYDMILGMDCMVELGIYINTADKVVQWNDIAIPLKAKGQLDEVGLEALYDMSVETPILQQAEARQKRILDADYSKVDLEAYIEELKHLNKEERSLLQKVLSSHPTLFGGGLGQLNINPIHLELTDGAKPYHARRAFPIPQAYKATTKKEMDRLVSIGVLEKNSDSEWAAPTFIQPKKTGDVRVLTDFRRLNAMLRRKPHPLPKISELLQELEGFRYATAIDLSMGYYHIPLDKHSQKLCTTILPWAKYSFRKLPMGVSTAPDIFQRIVDDILGDLQYVRAYIDDILIISNGTYADHMEKLETVLSRLERAGFRARVNKCFFAQSELEYLGYWLTREGIQPQPKKVEAILRLKEPQNVRQLRHFLGMVNYYRDMWRRRSHLLAPMTALLSKKVKWNWTQECQESFDEIKRVISQETLLAFPDFTKTFHIYTDASDYQLGAVIMQEGKPLAFYSRKLNAAQKRYTTGEQELLSIVETLKEFRTILLGQKLVVHTDHKNIIYGNLTNDRIARWRLLLEEFGPEYVHVAGKDNIVADALSRMDIKDHTEAPQSETAQMAAYCMATLIRDERDMNSGDIQECCFGSKEDATEQGGLTAQELEGFPMDPKLLAKAQKRDKQLLKAIEKSRKDFTTKVVEGQELLCYNSKIVVPAILQDRIVAWTHQYLVHPGQERMEKTLGRLFTWPKMRNNIRDFVKSCRRCQLCKAPSKKYGHLPAKKAEPPIPWNRVNVDAIGPYTVRLKGTKRTVELRAITMIDPATGWFEIAAIDAPTADECMRAMDDVWINRYPRPKYIGVDNGGEFKSVFKQMCSNYGITRKPSTSHNPQANSIVERVHQVLGNMLRTFELEEQELSGRDPFGSFLSAAAYAIRSTYHTTLEATPAELVFGRNMLLPVQFKADWEAIRARRQELIDENNRRENARRIEHTYKVGDKVAKKRHGILPKLRRKYDAPYTVTKVYSNGTVQIQQGALSERINIRLIKPYIET